MKLAASCAAAPRGSAVTPANSSRATAIIPGKRSLCRIGWVPRKECALLSLASLEHFSGIRCRRVSAFREERALLSLGRSARRFIGNAVELTRGGESLPELGQQRIDAAAIALDYRGEFVALGHLHADAADIDVGNLGRAAAVDQIPVDHDPAAVRTVDLAGDDSFVAGRPAADDPERLAAIFAEPRGVGLHDVF